MRRGRAPDGAAAGARQPVAEGVQVAEGGPPLIEGVPAAGGGPPLAEAVQAAGVRQLAAERAPAAGGEPLAAEDAAGPGSVAGGERERVARAALTQILEPGDERNGRWLRRFGAEGLLGLLMSDGEPPGAPLPGVSARGLVGLRARAADVVPGRRLDAARAAGGRFAVPGDAEWPTQLDDLGDARPIGLWVRGGFDLRRWALRSVALVGARACTPYGAHMATTLAAGLAERGWVVVSGAAFGVDGAAHRGALAAGGATVAVLACGVDTAYPRGHAELIGRIARQGLLVSELPPGEHPTASRCVNCTKSLIMKRDDLRLRGSVSCKICTAS
ncbi:DNA-processing protein DprA [Streptomyces zhihengii]|uniref:DNA-processing protein DprA n=1 Tax=Streptomyces zhihengii TaxID=1818004 RepID=A0ABS2UNY4_9ACTN|nr:DNA-processing protein DprA [Streptomyces zhihengii]